MGDYQPPFPTGEDAVPQRSDSRSTGSMQLTPATSGIGTRARGCEQDTNGAAAQSLGSMPSNVFGGQCSSAAFVTLQGESELLFTK